MSGERRTEYYALADIKRARRNPKQHDDASIRDSLTRFGMAELVLLDGRTGLLVAGEGRINALCALRDKNPGEPPDGVTIGAGGEWMVPVTCGWSSRDDKEADAYLIASNRLSERGGWDGLGLAEMVASLEGELAGIGYTASEVDDLLRETGFLASQATKFLDDLPQPQELFSGTAEDPFAASSPAAPAPSASPFTADTPPAPVPAPQSPPPPGTLIPPGTVPAPGTTEPQWFQLTWSATHEQREVIHQAIRAARARMTDLTTAISALTAVCQYFLDYAESSQE